MALRGFEPIALRRSLIITIKAKTGDVWPVEAMVQEGSRTIRAGITGDFTLDEVALLAEGDPRKYGELLAAALFTRSIRDAFLASVTGTELLHLELSLDAKELRPLLWERLCGPGGAGFGFLALDQRVAYSRYIPSPQDRGFRGLRRRELRALVVIACPDGLKSAYNLEPFDTQAVAVSVRQALGDIPCELLGPVEGAVGPATLDAICEALTRTEAPILHIVAHGGTNRARSETVLYLAGAKGNVEVVERRDFVSRLGLLARGVPRFIFFAACESGVESGADSLGGLARLLVGDLGVPAVLAMSSRVAITTADALTRSFYVRLLAHGHVDQALVEASAGLAGHRDALVPALYGHLGSEPLFAPEDESAPGAGPEPEWSDVAMRGLGEALQRAYLRRERLRLATQSTHTVDVEISGLRQRLRRDGQLHSGDMLADGRYLLLALSGEGLSSTVWRAHDRKQDREVALKVLHPQHARRPELVRRFQRAALRMQELEHPHIVPVLGPPEEDQGRHFFPMKLLPGGSLADAVRRRKLAADGILPIVRALGAALEYAHRRQLLHRDVEPNNVLFDENDRACLTDFDMALTTGKILDTGASQLSPAVYVAPECSSNHPEARVETDVYGLAMVTLYMYAGAAPIEALHRPRRFVGRLACPPAVRRALLRAASFDPRDRHPAISAFLADIDAPPAWPRRRWIALLGALLVSLLVSLLVRAMTRP
jgi:tRNA A-37 threonylcarbamoyl transferase component Bud32